MRPDTSYFRKYAFLFLAFVSCSSITFGQNPDLKPKPIAPAPAITSSLSTSADETFILEIDERRFVKENFEVGTAVDTGSGSSQVNVRVGVSLTADRIEVLLRNVHGNVRFRGGLDRILGILDRRAPAPGPEVR